MKIIAKACIISWILVAIGMWIRYQFIPATGPQGLDTAASIVFFGTLGMLLIAVVFTVTLVMAAWQHYWHPEEFQEH